LIGNGNVVQDLEREKAERAFEREAGKAEPLL